MKERGNERGNDGEIGNWNLLHGLKEGKSKSYMLLI